MDDFGIVYIIENAQQFWSELEDILQLSRDASLAQLDATLARFVTFCATYHEQYLQTQVQLEHACTLLLHSELFAFHSERMRERLLVDAEKITDPHAQLIMYQVLLQYGRNHPSLLRSQKKWQPLLPLLMDHVLLDFDPDVEDSATNSSWTKSTAPIEANLRILAVGILYEVCRVQKFSVVDLRIFDDAFIDHLFDLVELTRHMQDETLNYSLIKLIVALNEQFMVASISANSPTSGTTHHESKQAHPEENGLNFSKTFGENMIFMLNRAGRSPEDLCMQLLVLKILYLLFTTKGTSEYFYTNDLCVLVDVFLRELVDLDEDSESLRHTYLRVLHPLLTRTQLRSVPYKRPQVVRTLESLISHPGIRDINATTKRLVERCLSGDWCVQLRKVDSPGSDSSFPGLFSRVNSPGSDSMASTSKNEYVRSFSPEEPRLVRPREKSLKMSRSVENLRSGHGAKGKPYLNGKDAGIGMAGNGTGSELSLADVAASVPSISSVPNTKSQPRATTLPDQWLASSSSSLPSSTSSLDKLAGATAPSQSSGRRPSLPRTHTHASAHPGSAPSAGVRTTSLGQVVDTIVAPTPVSGSMSAPAHQQYHQQQHRRAAPPAPPKRRKPPAIPVHAGTTTRTAGGATMTTIARSTPSPLSRVPPVMPSYFLPGS
ncbi:hypothetical protein DFH11DRAFT_1778458 [Phellopilus nigrolimitatus]|nr:hypothetical protein DFH11DRAFT_1778458 [Phellopilus nigrolimitatus]